MVGHWNLQWTL